METTFPSVPKETVMRRSMVPHGEDAWKENIWPAEKFHFYNFSLAAGIFCLI